MGFNSQVQFDFFEKSYRYKKGSRVIELLDQLMLIGWDIFSSVGIHVLDKGDNFDFVFLEKKLSNYAKLVRLLEYKELNNERISVNLIYPGKGNIQIFFS